MEREKIENCHEKEIAEHVSENESHTDAWAFGFKSRGTDSVEHDAADVSAGPGCDKDAEEYNMRHPKRGVALILNHQEFADEAPRRGSSRDCENLCAELEKLGFETRVHKDLTYIALSAVLTETALEDHSTADCLMVIAMTHGDSGYLHSRDTVYHTQELWLHFTGDKCPTLVGKPKIFFIQACRGTMVDSGVSVDVTDSYTTSYVIPTQADIVIAYSTVDGTDGNAVNRNVTLLLELQLEQSNSVSSCEMANGTLIARTSLSCLSLDTELLRKDFVEFSAPPFEFFHRYSYMSI